jgi:hypothetical protein
MSIPKIYLETTMFNFPFADDAPQYKADTLKVFDLIKAGKFEPYTSVYAIEELDDTKGDKREEMKRLIVDYEVQLFEKSDEAESLAAIYVSEDVISPKFRTDAIHIAMTTVNGLDFIVSLNFQHIVRPWTIERVEKINEREGYRKIGIFKPEEVLNG